MLIKNIQNVWQGAPEIANGIEVCVNGMFKQIHATISANCGITKF